MNGSSPRWARLVAGVLLAGAAALPAGAQEGAAGRSPLDSFRARRGISRGLAFLAASQRPDGAWPASPSHDPIHDTALCGLALLAEGSTPQAGRFKEPLRKAVDYLAARVPSRGPLRVARPTGGDYELYETWYAAFAGLFLAEVAMKGGPPELKKKLDALVRRLVVLQRPTGGWCHDLRDRMARSGTYVYAWYSEDLAIATAYAVASLVTMKRAGATVPGGTLERALAYLRRIHNEDGGFQYGRLHSWPRAVESEPGRTAAVIFALTWLKRDEEGLPRAVAYLEKQFEAIPVSAGHAGNVFSLNYLSGALACRRWSAALWRRFAEVYVPRLLAARRPGGRFELGKSHHDRPALSTALALLVLELPGGHLSFAAPPPGDRRPALPPPDLDEPVEKRSVPYLLGCQRADGSWIANPKYASPGKVALAIAPPRQIFVDDSMAVTALCARALLTHPGAEPKRSRRAVERAVGFLKKTLAAERERYATAETSPIWQAYAIDLLLDLHASNDPAWAARREELAALVRQVIACLEAGECEGGGWTYTYYDSTRGTPRSFSTALVVRSLLAAKERGFTVPGGLLERGLGRLDRARLESGGYRYVYAHPDWPPRTTPMGSIGRMALIEQVRLRAGRARPGELARAVTTFFKHRALLDRAVRQQTEYGNEGCHHYFAYYHLAEALALLPAGERAPLQKQVALILRRSRRPDGSWWDSERAGPAAATAMALLALATLH